MAKSRVVRSVRSVQIEWQAPACEQMGFPWLRYVEPDGTVHGSAADPHWSQHHTLPMTMRIALGASANTLWVLDSAGTIHRSADAGCTWSVVTAAPEVLAREFDAEFAARHAERVYVYTVGRHQPRPTSILRLTGSTVERFAVPDPRGFVKLEVSPTNPLHLRAIGKLGIAWESTDGAATWTAHGSPSLFIGEARSASFNPQNFDHILVGTKTQGLWESRDGGKTWKLTHFGATEVEGVRFAPSNPNVIYAGVVPSRLYRSTDGGATFTLVDVSANLPWARLYYMERLFTVNPRDPLTFAAGGERGIGLKMIGPDGTRTSKAFENVGDAVWAPSGILYYVMTWAELR